MVGMKVREKEGVNFWYHQSLQSIFNFCFSDKTFQIVDRTTQEGGGRLHSHVNFFPPAPSPQGGPLPFMRWKNLFALATSLPTQHFSRKEEEAGNSYLSRGHFSEYERLQCWVHKGSCNNSTKNTLRGELIVICLKNGIHLHNRLSNDELEQCSLDVVAVVSKSFLDLSARCSLFSSFSYLYFLVCITVYMSTLQGLKVIFQLLAWICRLLSRPIFSRLSIINEQSAHGFNTQHDLLTVIKGRKQWMHTKQHKNFYLDWHVSLRQFPF